MLCFGSKEFAHTLKAVILPVYLQTSLHTHKMAMMKWQVAYEPGDVTSEGVMWWDYPDEINRYINEHLAAGDTSYIAFRWPWERKTDADGNQMVSEYVLDPVQCLVVNRETQHVRRVRRVTIDPEHPGTNRPPEVVTTRWWE